jgi:Asp/Glu/hydantoin racemase
MSTAESSSRLWYQSFVDPNEQRPYIDRLRGHLASIADPGFRSEVVGISPPDRVLHPLTEFRCAAQVIRNAIAAEQQGFAAFVIGHFQEPGLHECKASVGIPVVGLGESTMLYACTLGRKIGLVTINPVFIPWHEDQITRYGLRERVISVRSVDTSVGGYMRAFEDTNAYAEVRAQFTRQASALVDLGAEIIIPAGGLPMLLFAREKEFAVRGATVLNGINVVTKVAEMAVKLARLDGTSVSRASWYSKASPEAIREFWTIAEAAEGLARPLQFHQPSSSFGTLPPLSAIFFSTVLCNHMFMAAESPILSAGQPSSVASSLRAARLLSMPRSFSRSTIETFQLSFSGLAAASFSSLATTSTTAIGAGAAGLAAGAGAAWDCGVPCGVGAGRACGAGAACAAPEPMPSFSRILPNRLIEVSFPWWDGIGPTESTPVAQMY